MDKHDLVFNPRGLRHYRRTYSRVEWKIGLCVMAALLLIAGWIRFKGAHADPALFANTPELLDPGEVPVSRGALPPELAPKGFREGKIARFNPDNLYEKIDGRADYFKSLGFVELVAATLVSESDPTLTVDIEFYDLGNGQNSLGAYSGEKSEGVVSEQVQGGLSHIERNALFLARGKYYVRVIGSSEDGAMRAVLEHVRGRLNETLAAGERPWAHPIFVDKLGILPGDVSYNKENAFSFDFGNDVYSAPFKVKSSTKDDDEEVELFLTRAETAASAAELAEKFVTGFAELGARVPDRNVMWVKDRYLGSFSTALAEQTTIYGVRGASTAQSGRRALEALREAESESPAKPLDRAAEPTNTEAPSNRATEPTATAIEPTTEESSHD